MKRIVDLIDNTSLSGDERLELLDELYWADWSKLKADYPEDIEKIFDFLRKSTFNPKETSLILKLYNNPEGAFIEEFSIIIAELYNKDRVGFIKALRIDPDEGEILAYLFRNMKIFEDMDSELNHIVNNDYLSEEEKDVARSFFRIYENLCNT